MKLKSNINKSDVISQIARYEFSIRVRNIQKYGPDFLIHKKYLKEVDSQQEKLKQYNILKEFGSVSEEEKMFGKHDSSSKYSREIDHIKIKHAGQIVKFIEDTYGENEFISKGVAQKVSNIFDECTSQI